MNSDEYKGELGVYYRCILADEICTDHDNDHIINQCYSLEPASEAEVLAFNMAWYKKTHDKLFVSDK